MGVVSERVSNGVICPVCMSRCLSLLIPEDGLREEVRGSKLVVGSSLPDSLLSSECSLACSVLICFLYTEKERERGETIIMCCIWLS